jgi:hypothetical protein
MKRLFILIVVLIVAIGLQAQDYSGKLRVNDSWDYINTNQTLTNADTIEVEWEVESYYPFTLDVGLNTDSVSGSSTTDTLFVYGRKYSDQDWTLIGSAVRRSGNRICI